MTLSFVIPAYNEERRIGACLRAIVQELHRAGAEAEIIVVNNASTDGTREEAERIPGVRVVDESRKGVVRARQRGLLEARGDLVAHIDADCELIPGWLDTVQREFERDPRLVCLSGPYRFHDLPLIKNLTTKLYFALGFAIGRIQKIIFGVGEVVIGGNFVVRRETMLAAGGYNTEIEFYGDDTDVSRQLSRKGKVKFTYDLPILSSGRRLIEHGLILSGYRYVINYFWMLLFRRPLHRREHDLIKR